MKLSERLFRTSERQARLGRYRVAEWYWEQRAAVLASGHDPEHGPLRGVIERYQEKRPFLRASGARPSSAVHLTK